MHTKSGFGDKFAMTMNKTIKGIDEICTESTAMF